MPTNGRSEPAVSPPMLSHSCPAVTEPYMLAMLALAPYGGPLSGRRSWLDISEMAASAVCFNSVRRREIVVAMADRTIHCYNIDNCQLIANYLLCPGCSTLLAVHPTRPLAISTSGTESVLWDTENWERKRILVGSTSGMQQACFSQDGLSIVAAFEDGSIFFGWSIRYVGNGKLPWIKWQMLFPDAEAGTKKLLSSQRSSTVDIWNIFERRLMHEILIPAFRETLILQIAFVGTSNIIALLSDTGVLIFINASEAKFVGHLQGRHVFHSFFVIS
ncbi:hypothetical protein BASA61_007140 [Batrachochytrium salamandrivorans]|nr:hypothetical protein BASA61_007140 [Batrachochytrium salamandrivorans]